MSSEILAVNVVRKKIPCKHFTGNASKCQGSIWLVLQFVPNVQIDLALVGPVGKDILGFGGLSWSSYTSEMPCTKRDACLGLDQLWLLVFQIEGSSENFFHWHRLHLISRSSHFE